MTPAMEPTICSSHQQREIDNGETQETLAKLYFDELRQVCERRSIIFVAGYGFLSKIFDFEVSSIDSWSQLCSN